jgi:hypothetical protein
LNQLQNLYFANAIPAQSLSGATATDNEIDTVQNGVKYNWLTVVISLGAIGAAGITTLKLQESDSTGASEADFTGGAFSAVVDADDNKLLVANVKLDKRKRYISIVCTAGANACLVSAVAILSRANESPNGVTAQNLLQMINV